jgi:glycosyltransferase involved in cell wall biosynthesis
MKIALVVMFLNEERFLGTLLESAAAQTRPPDRVLLVDDGSSDRSPRIATDFVARHPYARLLQRPPRPPERDRLASASVWASFQWGVDQLDRSFDVVAKIDADLWLTPTLLEEIEQRFTSDPALGIAGPRLIEARPDGSLRRIPARPEHVPGATKFYRRQCYDDVFPLPALLDFEIMDEVKARRRGWRTENFASPGGDPLHLRPMRSEDGLLRGLRRWGRGDYVSGSQPLLVAYVGLVYLRERPWVVGALNYYAGWVTAAARRTPRFDAELRALRRQEQLDRARCRIGALLRRGRPLPGG